MEPHTYIFTNLHTQIFVHLIWCGLDIVFIEAATGDLISMSSDSELDLARKVCKSEYLEIFFYGKSCLKVEI